MATKHTSPHQLLSAEVAFGDTSPVTIFDIPANTYVANVVLFVTTAWAGTSPTLDVGISGDADGWVDNQDVTQGTTGPYKGTSGNGASLVTNGQLYTSATQIIVTIGGTNLTAGACRVQLEYSPWNGLVTVT